MSTQRLDDTHVLCRTYGHTWRPVNVVRTLNSRGAAIEYRAYLHCDRCGSSRTQRLDGQGDILGNTYRYADGYAKRPEEERITRFDARHEYLTRLGNRMVTVHENEENDT